MSSSHLFFEPVEAYALDFDKLIHRYEEPCELRSDLRRLIVAYRESDQDIMLAVGFGPRESEIAANLWFACKLASAGEDSDLSGFRDLFQTAGEICQQQNMERLSAHFRAGRSGFV